MADHGITDYRKILAEYMRTVLFEEGITFASSVSDEALTKEELAALCEVENEVKDDPHG